MDSSSINFIDQVVELDTQSLFFSTLLVCKPGVYSEKIESSLTPLVGELSVACDGQTALDILETEFLELVVLSLDLADVSAVSLLSTIQHFRPGLPVLVIADKQHLHPALMALREGAWDYVISDDAEDFNNLIVASVRRMAERKIELIRETSLRSERLAFWAAVQRAQDGLAIIGTNGSVSFANPCFQDFVNLLGGTLGDDGTLDIVKLLSEVDSSLSEQLRLALRHTKMGESMWRSELKFIPTSELEERVERYFQIDLSSISVTGGESAGIESRRHVLWVSDITSIKEHEQFQREVISTTSHDLKGPLATITCAAEMIVECDPSHSENTVKLLKLITNAAKKSQSHIEEFLSAKRIEAGVLTVEQFEYPLTELLTDLVTEYSMSAATKDILVSLNSDISDLKIFADKLAFNRVIGNIISNAIKFTQSQGKIELFAEQNETYLRIQIRDNGPGIEQGVLHTLFDRYSRLKQHNAIEGSGLGLFIVKSIMEAHGGRVEVQSELGVGTVFSLYFPNRRGD